MITEKQKQQLRDNWGDLADSLHCKAILRIYDDHSTWQCYVLAMNPQDDDIVKCVIFGFTIMVDDCRLSEIFAMYNENGDHPRIDYDFVPRNISTIMRTYEDNMY